VYTPVIALRAAIIIAAAAGMASAQEQPPSDATALAKKTQNPVGDLVSIPLQFNFYSGQGLGKQSELVLNVQPVLPIRTVTGYTLIARTIVPYVSVPLPDGSRVSGLADIQEELFVTPAVPGRIIWGVGPVLSFPTSTNAATTTGDWGLGPTAVVLTVAGPWVYGALISQVWTIAGTGGASEVNQLTLQPFVNFNFGLGWSIGTSPLISANWSGGTQWTVPLGVGISKVTAVGHQPVNLGLAYYNNVVGPASAGRNQLRLTISLLFPAAK
jgi:hypothetical protein